MIRSGSVCLNRQTFSQQHVQRGYILKYEACQRVVAQAAMSQTKPSSSLCKWHQARIRQFSTIQDSCTTLPSKPQMLSNAQFSHDLEPLTQTL